MSGSIGFIAREKDINNDSKQFLLLMYGLSCEKRVLVYQTMNIDQLYSLINTFGKLTSCLKWAWLEQINCWSPSVLRGQIKGLADSGWFSEIDKALGHRSIWRGINLRHIHI